MKITPDLLLIPPHLSVPWNQIEALFTRKPHLVVLFKQGGFAEVPDLSVEEIHQIFDAYSKYRSGPLFPFPLGLDLFDPAQHNPSQSHLPSLPKGMLEHILKLKKLLPEQEGVFGSNLEDPGCNCLHCQIARASEPFEEPISDEEISFSKWQVKETAPKIYQVTNPLNQAESYCVFLGDPLGCTCGNPKCEHLKAVLET